MKELSLDNPKDKFQLWTADLVCPVRDSPIRNGAVLTSKGKILAVGEEEFIRPRGTFVTETHFENSILIPGLVNSHTHLELSGMQISPSKMSDWIPDLVSQIREWPSHLFLSSSKIGTANSISSGVTCVGDISISGESKTAMVDAGMKGIVFHEFLGINAKEVESIFDKRMNREGAISGMIIGIVFTTTYIIYFTPKLGGIGTPEGFWFGISPQGIGTLGMLFNFIISIVVSRMTDSPPLKNQQLTENIRIPRN